MMTIVEILKYIGQPIIIVGAVTYLFKTLGEYFLDKRLKSYEKELDNQRFIVEKEINLFITKSSRLYDDQLLTLKDLYKKLSSLNREMSILTVRLKLSNRILTKKKRKGFLLQRMLILTL